MTIRLVSFWLLLVNSLAVTSAFLIYYHGGRDPFGERGFITFLSTFQLLTVALLADKICQAQKAKKNDPKSNSVLFWRVISWGFIFLAADEYLSIHEITDLFIHDVFDFQETSLTDRIDDLIVGSYGLIGIGVLVAFRHQLKPFKRVFPFFKLGFFFLFLMVATDLITNGEELNNALSDYGGGRQIHIWLGQLEEAFKVYSEAFFILAFYAILKNINTRQKQVFKEVNSPQISESVGRRS